MAKLFFSLCVFIQVTVRFLLAHVGGQVTIQVSERGQDVQSCLYDESPCKTLMYVLCQLETVDSKTTPSMASINVKVMYNQTISTANKCNFSSSSVRNITIFGYKKPFINFHQFGSLQITHSSSTAGLNWTWIELGFAWFGPQESTCRNPALQYTGMYGDAFKVDQCEFISVAWAVADVQNIAVNGSEFGNKGFCPITCMSNGVSSGNEGTIEITNNKFQNCQVSLDSNSILKINNQPERTSIKIVGNTFSGILGDISATYFRPLIKILIGNHQSFYLQENIFDGNDLVSGVLIYTDVPIMSIERNTFQHYNTQGVSLKRQTHAIAILTIVLHPTTNGVSVLKLVQNEFKNNSNIRLLNIQAAITENSKFFISISNLNALNNSGSTELISIRSLGLKENLEPECFCVIMNSLHLESNNARMQDETTDDMTIETDAVIHLLQVTKVTISNSSFESNCGISLLMEPGELKYFDICFLGNIRFQDNSGYLGGALSLSSVQINSTCKSEVSFEGNQGVYGGALYIENFNNYLLYPPNQCSTIFKFANNSARTAGNSIYFATLPWDLNNECFNHSKFNSSDLGSVATEICVRYQSNYLKIFPGQTIAINGSVMDWFGSPSSCMANVYITCDTSLYKSCFDLPIKLLGPDKVMLIQSDASKPIDTNVAVKAPQYPNYSSIQLKLLCKEIDSINPPQATIPLNVTSCPEGFLYNSSLQMCQCAPITTNMACSTKVGAACVEHGYWYGKIVVKDNITDYTVVRCKYNECRHSTVQCPAEMQVNGEFFMLNNELESQCSHGRGGDLCRKCDQNFIFSFLTVDCISDKSCRLWQPYFILFFGILFQFLVAITLLLVIRFKHSLGSGFLYGPMLFLALVSHLPLDNYTEYSTLSDAVSITASVALLNLELFGRIPWCFFPIPKQYNYSLRFLGPLTILMVLVSLTFLARRHPNCCCRWWSCIKKSVCSRISKFSLLCYQVNAITRRLSQFLKAPPLKVVCILMLLSFWSLADTSINILTPTVFEFRESPPLYMVSIQPDIRYFSPQHLPVAIPALLVLLVLILPLVAVLLLSPFLQRVINLHRIMPFLDEFQSCYEDRYRWYSGVYFVVWIIIVGIQGLPDFLLFTQTIFIILLCAQFLIKPYKSKLLNITDTLLLVDINFLISLIYKHSYSSPSSHVQSFSNLLIHALVIVPFVCAIISVICVLAIKSGVYDCILTRVKRKPSSQLQTSHGEQQQPPSVLVPVQEISINDEQNHEREPLIAIVGNP